MRAKHLSVAAGSQAWNCCQSVQASSSVLACQYTVVGPKADRSRASVVGSMNGRMSGAICTRLASTQGWREVLNEIIALTEFLKR